MTRTLPPLPDEAAVRAAVDAALASLIKRDAQLLEFNVNERSVSHRLALYLQALFPDWDVDCEYNRDMADPKVLEKPDDAIAWDDTDAKTVFPDVIVHIRGSDHNLLVIEMKKTGHGPKADFDRDKIGAYLNQFGYRFGVFIPFTTGTLGAFGPLEWRIRAY
jgi:hypothetical protein